MEVPKELVEGLLEVDGDVTLEELLLMNVAILQKVIQSLCGLFNYLLYQVYGYLVKRGKKYQTTSLYK